MTTTDNRHRPDDDGTTRRWRSRSVKAAVIVFWLLVWQVLSMVVGNDLLLAGPYSTLCVLCTLVVQSTFWATIAYTFTRIVAGFLVAFILALLIGGLSAHLPFLRALLQPLVTVFKSVPVVCLIVLLLIWFGSKNVSAICVFLVVFPGIYFSVIEALSNLDTGIDEMLHLYSVPPLRRLLASTWPQMLPYIQATSKVVVGMSWKAGVAAELIGMPLGSIGEQVYQSKLLLETPELFSWTIVIIAISFLCEKAFLALLRRSEGLSRSWSIPRHESATHPAISAPGAFSLHDVCVTLGGVRILEHLDLQVEAGRRLCLTDPSGAGKTTLLRVLSGLLAPTGGEATAPQRISMMFQETRLIEDMSARENVMLVAGRYRDRATMDTLLCEILPEDILDRPVRQMSGGQRRRVELARAVAYPSQALILDEPFAALDETTHGMSRGFLERNLEGRTLIMATHDRADGQALHMTGMTIRKER